MFRKRLKELAVLILRQLTCFVKDETFIKITYWMAFGVKPNLDRPKTYNEHVQYLKLRNEEFEYAKYTDKYEVRKYVENTIGVKYLNQIYGIYEKSEDIPWDDLPDAFALKCTHGSAFNIITNNKDELNIVKAKKRIVNWLKSNYFYAGRERNYYNIKPRIMIENYINSSNENPMIEYKLFCIKGKVCWIQANYTNQSSRGSCIYTREWEIIPVNYGYNKKTTFSKPSDLELMIEISEKLSEPFRHVRVDLLSLKNRLLFGELTFHPGGGLLPFDPICYDLYFGHYFYEEKAN